MVGSGGTSAPCARAVPAAAIPATATINDGKRFVMTTSRQSLARRQRRKKAARSVPASPQARPWSRSKGRRPAPANSVAVSGGYTGAFTKEIPMSLESQLGDLLKDAMRQKDLRTADCIRMIKTKHMERRTAAGFKGPLDDALWLDVIASYQKQLRKSREEYVAVGERGADALPQIDFE